MVAVSCLPSGTAAKSWKGKPRALRQSSHPLGLRTGQLAIVRGGCQDMSRSTGTFCAVEWGDRMSTIHLWPEEVPQRRMAP